MTTKPLAGKKIAIMVANGFDEIEFTEPQKQLIEAGANVKTVSRANGLVNGWYEGAWGHFYPVDADLADTLAIDFDGLVIPGGTRNVEKLVSDPHGVRILKAFLRADMPTALIGDAAACASLLAGEGTGLAMVEAYILAGEISRAPNDHAAAFARFEERLMPFVKGKQKAALQVASSFVPDSRLGIILRNVLTKLFRGPFIVKLAFGDLTDDIELPAYEEAG